MRRKRIAQRIFDLFSSATLSDETFDELEDTLIEGDVGVTLAMQVVDVLRKDREARTSNYEGLLSKLKTILLPNVSGCAIPLIKDRASVILVLGVNGVGKTTAIARLAKFYQNEIPPDRMLFCAGDTFRPAAIDQLAIHAERLGVRIVKQQRGSDSGAVVFDSIESAMARNGDLVLADTAGRMHNKNELMRELGKIDRIISSRIENDAYHKLLVIDATTGQNGLRQTEVFHEAIGVDSIFLSKFDSSGKGGIALSIGKELGVPVSFLGTGESYDAIEVFDPESYLDALLG